MVCLTYLYKWQKKTVYSEKKNKWEFRKATVLLLKLKLQKVKLNTIQSNLY